MSTDKHRLIPIKKSLFLTELSSKLAESEEQYKNGQVHSAESVFKELRDKYGY